MFFALVYLQHPQPHYRPQDLDDIEACQQSGGRPCRAKNRLSWRDDRVDLVCSGRAGLAVQVEEQA